MKIHTKLMTEPRKSTDSLELEDAGELFSDVRKLICIDRPVVQYVGLMILSLSIPDPDRLESGTVN